MVENNEILSSLEYHALSVRLAQEGADSAELFANSAEEEQYHKLNEEYALEDSMPIINKS